MSGTPDRRRRCGGRAGRWGCARSALGSRDRVRRARARVVTDVLSDRAQLVLGRPRGMISVVVPPTLPNVVGPIVSPEQGGSNVQPEDAGSGGPSARAGPIDAATVSEK